MELKTNPAFEEKDFICPYLYSYSRHGKRNCISQNGIWYRSK